MGLIIHVDGGARGNPGPAGAGVVIREEAGPLVYEAAYFLGKQTNNAAEYHALLRALERAGQCPPQPVTVCSDSELLVRQITGEYQVKSAKLAPLHRQAQMLLLKLARWTIRHVDRERNRRADELANLAMDRRRDVIVFDRDSPGSAAATAATETMPAKRSAPAPATSTPQPKGGPTAARRAVRVNVSRAPQPAYCPAGGCQHASFTVAATLPDALCIHAAHALTPTLLAMLNTDADEFAAVPTLTVRCGRPGCRAEFQLSPIPGENGAVAGEGDSPGD